MLSRIEECVRAIRERTSFVPEIGIVLGSGLGAFGEQIDIECIVDYNDIVGFPVSTVSGHAGRFIFGYVHNRPIVAMQGRVHYYEGYSMSEVVLPVRVMKLLGIKTLILTNAAGGVNEAFEPGNLMLITDHISSFVPSPLVGRNIDELGTRFPDMSNVYSERLQTLILNISSEIGIDLKSGVYLQLTGPNYETPAEIRMCRGLGADAVGMSTACEAIAANHMGLEICGISCITNMASGILKQKLDHKEVQETADKASEDFKRLILALIKEI